MATILIVDDRPANRQYLVTLLGYLGHRLLEAADGAEALELARAERPDLVITDILMPVMDGYEFARQLRVDPDIKDIPIIFYTATYQAQEARSLAKAAGVQYVLTKPAEPQAILELVNTALEQTPASTQSSEIATKQLLNPLQVVSAKLTTKMSELGGLNLKLSELIELGIEIGGERDPVQMLEKFCESARKILNAKYAAVGILAKDGQSLQHFISSGMDPETVAGLGSLPTGKGILGVLIHEHQAIRLRDLTSDPRAVGFPPGHPMMRSFLGVPITTSAQVYGNLYLTEKIGAEEFSEEDERLAFTLASQVAVAYENAYLYYDIQRHAVKLQLEMTERQKAQEALAASHKRFESLIEHAPDGIALLGVDGKLRQVTPSTQQILGYSLEEAVGQDPALLTHPDDLPALLVQLNDVIQNPEKVIRAEYRFRHKDGSWRWLESTISNLVNEPSVQAVLFNYRDITERKQAEKDLRESEQKFSILFKRAPFAASLSRLPDGVIAEVNEEFEKLIGYPREDVIGKTSLELNLYPDPETRARMVAEFQARGFTRNAELEFQTKSGDLRHILINTDFIEIGGEKHLLTTAQDITERKQAEAALKVEIERFQRFVESNIVGIVIANAAGKVITANDYYLKILGLTRQDFEDGKVDWRRFTPPEWLPADEQAIQELRERGVCEPYEKEYVRADGTHVPVYLANAMLPGPEEQIAAFVLDITERKGAEEELRISEERFSKAFFASPAGLTITRIADGKFIDVNDAFLRMFEFSRAEVIGHTSTELNILSPEERTKLIQAQLESGGLRNAELQARAKSGMIVNILFSSKPMELGGETCLVTTMIDITERKQAEEALRESEERFRRAIHDAPYPIQIHAEDGKVIAVNQAWVDQTGYDPAEIATIQKWTDRAYREKAGEIRRQISELYDIKGRVDEGEEAIQTASGEIRIWKFSSAPLGRLSDGRRVVISMAVDITERKRAEQRIERQLQYLKALRTIDVAISSSFDIHVTLDIVLQQVLSQLGVDAAAILSLDLHKQILEYTASRGFHPEALHNARLKLGEGHASRAVLERKTIHISDLMETGGKPASSPLLAQESFVEYYGVPLIVKGEVKGVLEIYQRSPLRADPEWLEFLETMAGQAAIAIDNAQLFQGLQRANAELEQRVAQRTAELNQLNLELTHANRAKDEFLANMSHELRTPLNSILGLSETLLEKVRGPLNERQEQALQVIASSGQHLLGLINDVLEVAKIEAGKLDINPDIIDLQQLCQASLNFVKESALKKSISLEFHADPSISTVFADLQRLKQILVNLLSNAVKFTPERGTVTLDVSTNAERDQIRFSVTDDGIGIASEDLYKLFNPFVQLDGGLSRQNEGTGLGLTIVYKLAELHGGSVHVESEFGKGSRFTVILPWNRAITTRENLGAAPAHIQTPAVVIGKPEQPSDARIRILVAEDNETNQLMLNDYLQDQGFAVSLANNGIEALAKAEETLPDLILMDIQMPEMHGLEAIQRLRADPRFVSTPIIALTALAMPGDRERCLEAGANEYISKPVSLKDLVKTIKSLLPSANQ